MTEERTLPLTAASAPGSEIVAAGDAPREDGRFFSQVSELRQRADYGYEEPEANVDALLSRTQQLVSRMETICADGE